jgi:Calcineurin-like phosphoesterase
MMNTDFQNAERLEGSHPKKRFVSLLMIFVLSAVALQTLYRAPLRASAASVVLVGAGDIASCSYTTDTATARLLDSISGTVFTTGDNVYPNGTYTQYMDCYHPTWGRHKSRTKPVPGNHEYNTSGAAGYFRYFSNTGSYYAYNLGDWRVYALNSNIDVSATSSQVTWLKNDLAANPKRCVLAYWHHPRWSSGSHYGNNSKYQALWKTLYDAGAELVLNGHEHNYERFKQMNASGSAVSQGLREIVVGTGGAALYGFGTIRSTSEVRNSSTHGVLKLTLSSTSYSWKFVPVAGKTFTDSGTTNCH